VDEDRKFSVQAGAFVMAEKNNLEDFTILTKKVLHTINYYQIRA
jgi:hypothetical protein